MGGYIINFTVYTLAMSGLIFAAFYIYKKVMNGNINTAKTKGIIIEETLSINPRKSLMIVKVGEERFLLASDIDKTSLISKLGSNDKVLEKVVGKSDILSESVNFKSIIADSDEKTIYNEPNDSIEDKNIELNNLYDNMVHLEVISNKNPNPIHRKSSYTSKSYRQGKTVTIDVGKTVGQEKSPIKGIVKKVNNI